MTIPLLEMNENACYGEISSFYEVFTDTGLAPSNYGGIYKSPSESMQFQNYVIGTYNFDTFIVTPDGVSQIR